jgi:hypothetical protein
VLRHPTDPSCDQKQARSERRAGTHHTSLSPFVASNRAITPHTRSARPNTPSVGCVGYGKAACRRLRKGVSSESTSRSPLAGQSIDPSIDQNQRKAEKEEEEEEERRKGRENVESSFGGGAPLFFAARIARNFEAVPICLFGYGARSYRKANPNDVMAFVLCFALLCFLFFGDRF